MRVLDADAVAALLPQLVHLLSRGVGLPTRTGSARFVVQMAQQHPELVQPHGARLLRTLHRASLHEASEVARSAYYAASAQVARGAPSDVLAELVGELRGRYTSDAGGVEDETRLAVGGMLRELLRVATDAMGRVKAEWVALLFLGKHEPRSQAEVAEAPTNAQKEEKGKLASLWTEAYDEAGIGPSALLVHLQEIVALLTTVVEGPSWALRRAAAHCVIDLHTLLPQGSLARHPTEAKALAEIEKRADAVAPRGTGAKAGEAETEVEAKAQAKAKAEKGGVVDVEADSGDF